MASRFRRPSAARPVVGFVPVVKQQAITSVYVTLGNGAAVATASGGWAVVSRPKKKGFTTWEGYEPYQMTIKVVFDGLRQERSVEPRYESLRRIMRTPVGPIKQPSPCILTGPVPLKNLRWVIQSIEPDESSIIRRQRDGRMIRIAATVTLLEYVEADVAVALKPSPAAAAAEQVEAPAVRTYTVVRGDTLSKIAQTHLGSYKRWPEIASLNTLRDPNLISPGQVLRLP